MTWNDAIPDAGAVIFIVMVAFICALSLYIDSRRAPRAAAPILFPGIQGLSRELARIVERMPPEEFARVVDAAMEITADDFAGEADVEQAIAAYRAAHATTRSLASKLALKANLCDSASVRLEEAGREEESAANYRKMCVLEGLSASLALPARHYMIVDDLVYALADGTEDLDLFVSRMIAKLSVYANSDGEGTG